MSDGDLIVIGAGILGLAHATLAAEGGLKVRVIDRDPRALGASIRNFGMVWPIGVPPGPRREMALKSREHWLRVSRAAGFWSLACGSLHLAYEADEGALLGEFAARARPQGFDLRLLDAGEVHALTPALRPEGLLGALYSPTELAVDPREALQKIPAWLAAEKGVNFHFGDPVVEVSGQRVRCASGASFQAERVIVCPGHDLKTLFPEILAKEELRPCQLHMLRTAPQPAGFRIGPHLAGGLTLRHYEAFEGCPSLPRLKARIARDTPEYDRFGIHVMAAQNERGEVILGDSHEYGEGLSPDYKTEIEDAILRALSRWLKIPNPRIQDRWLGVYAKPIRGGIPKIPAPDPAVRIVTGVGGLGMTLSFGLAEGTLASL